MKSKEKKVKLKNNTIKVNNKKGITLIALVVTIIVLLILAGITIASIAGENGILNRASDAREQTEQATEDEQRQLAMAEAAMNLNGEEYQSTYNGEEVTVPIPAGFAPTRIEGEDSVEDGLVIIDSEGNEFVWIPCEYTKEVAEENKNSDAVIYNIDYNAENGITGDNRDNSWRKNKGYFYNGGTWYDSQPKKVGEKSITEHHGFFVARYEAGIPKEAPFYPNEGNGYAYYKNDGSRTENKETITQSEKDKKKNAKNTSEYKPVSQKGVPAWNYISQTNAVTVAKNMINTKDVQSYLIDSHAWNTICRIIARKDESKDLIDSTKWGNYENNTETKYEKLKGLWAMHINTSGWIHDSNYHNTSIPKKKANDIIELATGICEDFKAYNIYDLAGNMWEWTTEIGNPSSTESSDSATDCKETDCDTEGGAQNAVVRGGCFDVYGNGLSVVGAGGSNNVENNDLNFGFRVVLYLN